jgi:hypothetical protein
VACHFYVLKLRSQSDVYGFREFFRMYQGRHPDNHSWDPSCHSLCMPDMTLAVGGDPARWLSAYFAKVGSLTSEFFGFGVMAAWFCDVD